MCKMLSMLNPDFAFSDERGSLYQLVHSGWQQVNVSKTHKGTIRGGHYHKETREAFFVIEGQLEVELENGADKERHIFKSGDFFMIEPYAVHSFTFTDDTLMVALYDKPVEKPDGSKDIFKKGE